MSDSVQLFYDDLADDYQALFADWHASMRYQARVLNRLLTERLGPGRHRVLDCACGIGTQAIGLAQLGHQVHGTDLSPAAIERAGREAAALNASLTFGVADLRSLASQVAGSFDVVLACDNSLPHLLTDRDLRHAITNMAAKLRPGGLFLASIRDYDAVLATRPRTEGPQVFDPPEGRRITFQVWDWQDDGQGYDLHQFILRESPAGWHTKHVATTYRALRRNDLTTVLRDTGFSEIEWHEPADSGYYQPIVAARWHDRTAIDI